MAAEIHKKRKKRTKNLDFQDKAMHAGFQYSNKNNKCTACTWKFRNKCENKKSTQCFLLVFFWFFLQDLSSLVRRPFSSDGQRAAATALDLGHGQQAELEEDLYRGSKIGKKNLPNQTNPQIYNPNSNNRDVQLLSTNFH